LSYEIFENQELISDDNIHAFLMAICAIVVVFSATGAWGYVTDGSKININKLSISNYNLSFACVSVFFAYQVYANYSSRVFDDSAFTLRYLDNFWDGYFYHYNKLDPPVFGISCFSFGVFTGFFCWLHLLTPEASIQLAGFLGLAMLGFLIFKIIRELVTDKHLVIIFWLAIMFSSKMFLNVAKSGMETSFHLSIVFASLLFFLQNKHRWMWFFLALSIISKLDTVPLAATTGLLFLLLNKNQILPIRFSNPFLRNLVFFAVIPLLVWLVFISIVFGSPLPQSAYSKVFLHYHPDDYWFPFLKYYLFGGRVHLVFYLFLILFLIHFLLVCIKRRIKAAVGLVFGLSFIATMVLFYFYNPGEQMAWYYVLTDLLMLTQTVVSVAFLVDFIVYRWLRFAIVAAGIFFFLGWIGVDTIGGKYWMEAYLETVERERFEIGKYVGELVQESDSILSNHGLPVRHVKGYVIDMSGLNSKFAADYKIDPELMLKDHHPQWAINHNSVPYAALLSSKHYEPYRLFYDITNYTFPQWCLYKKLPLGAYTLSFCPVDSNTIRKDGVEHNGGIILYRGKQIVFETDSSQSIKDIFFGVKRQSKAMELEIRRVFSSGVQDTVAYIKAIGDYPKDSKYTQSVRVPLENYRGLIRVEVFVHTQQEAALFIEPYILKKANKHVF
jgi:hypothetical protein